MSSLVKITLHSLGFTTLRMLCILTLIILKSFFPDPYIYIYLTFLLGHYFLQPFYSKRQIAELNKTFKLFFPFFILSLLGGMVLGILFSVVVFLSGLHHALNETYSNGNNTDAVRISRFSLNLLTYIILLRHYPIFSFIPFNVLMGSFFLAYVCFVIFHVWSLKFSLDEVLCETVGFLCVLFLLDTKVGYEDCVFYHVLWWILYPLKKNFILSQKLDLRYVTLVFGLAFLIGLFTPLSGLFPQVTVKHWSFVANMFGCVHIVSSFALSKFNPHWLRALFVKN